MKWWCISSLRRPATVVVTRRTWSGSGCALIISLQGGRGLVGVRLLFPEQVDIGVQGAVDGDELGQPVQGGPEPVERHRRR